MATLATYSTIVQAEVDDNSARAQTVVERGLKDTYQEILKHVASFLVGTDTYSVVATPGTQEYTPTRGYSFVRVLWKNASESNFRVISEISEEEAIDKYYNSDNGTPHSYYRNAQNVILVPTPDNAGTLEVVYVPVQSELEGSTVSIIPDRYTNVIVLGAIARFKMYEGVPEAVEYQAKYAASLQDMKKELATQFAPLKPSFMGR